jgi:benzoylformate decarboxylase
VLVYGPEIDRAGGWDAGIKLAEHLRAPVFFSPIIERIPFPMSHPPFRGILPMAIGPLSERLQGTDLVVVVGAQVFRYYPFVPGQFLPVGAELLQITSDPNDDDAAAVGDSLLSDAKLALEGLMELVPQNKSRALPTPLPKPTPIASPPGGRSSGGTTDGSKWRWRQKRCPAAPADE